jgi:hypothetical protein
MENIALLPNNSAKQFEELTSEQKAQVQAMFAPLRPHTDYLYEIDMNGDVRCRRYNGARKPSGALLA